jgi:hypothetical protein
LSKGECTNANRIICNDKVRYDNSLSNDVYCVEHQYNKRENNGKVVTNSEIDCRSSNVKDELKNRLTIKI